MSKKSLVMENPQTGLLKEAPIGFNWLLFFFPGIVPLLRGDFKTLFIMLLLAIPTLGLIIPVYAAKYNKMYIASLLERGYKVSEAHNCTLQEASRLLGINLPVLQNVSS